MSLLPAALVLPLLFAWWHQDASTPPPLRDFIPATASVTAVEAGGDIPLLISEDDRERYRVIFAAQAEADWKAADRAAARLDSRLLMGHVLAERYLHKKYESKPKELAAWLEKYDDHPQAHDIYKLALAKSPALKDKLPALRRQRVLSGYGDNSASSQFTAAKQAGVWKQAMAAWRAGNKTKAAGLFADLSLHTKPGTPQSAAAGYWAWRSLNAIDNTADARMYLRLAARDTRSFYGILARKQLGLPLLVDGTPLELEQRDTLVMLHEPAIRRTVALARAGIVELAERELRALFPQAGAEEKEQLLALAHKLNLASVQITMARQLSTEARPLDVALYPIPSWQPQDGFKVDPALVYAVARKESGFNPGVTSPVGASGLMQLMPQTASMMRKALSIDAEAAVNDPSFNMMLGQNYLRHLLDNRLVDGNLIYMLTAYNAGPARLMEWKKRFGDADPLLFVEEIPYGETRHYVMQVLANYWIYSELTGRPAESLVALAKGRWPSYIVSERLAALQTAADKAG